MAVIMQDSKSCIRNERRVKIAYRYVIIGFKSSKSDSTAFSFPLDAFFRGDGKDCIVI